MVSINFYKYKHTKTVLLFPVLLVSVVSSIFFCKMATKCKLEVPEYKPEMSYSYYKDLIQSWADCTDTPKAQKAIKVAFTFNKTDPKLCEKIFTVVTRDKLTKDDGFETLVKFLDGELGKDDLEEMVQIYDRYENSRKLPGDSINKFISDFDHTINLLKAKKVTVPSEILGNKLLYGAGLSKTERLLVLTGVDYDKRDTFYDQTVKSLKKFKGEGSSTGASRDYGAGCSTFGDNGVSIKSEPTFFTGTRGVPYRQRFPGAFAQNRPSFRGNYGWRSMRPSTSSPWRGGRSDVGSWRGSRGMQYSPSNNWRSASNGVANSTGKGWRSGAGEKKGNPIGLDGQPNQCDCCRSIFHYVKDCPDSWENLKKVNFVDESGNVQEYDPSQMFYEEAEAYPSYDYQYDNTYSGAFQDDFSRQCDINAGNDGSDHHVVLYTGYNKADFLQLEVEAHNKAVLDSACSSTVCGKAWLEDFLNSRSVDDTRVVERRDSTKTFRFGNDGILKSEGEYVIPANLVGKPVNIVTDVVDSNIPLLLSLNSLKAAKVVIDTVTDSAIILGRKVSLDRTSSGHYCVSIVEDSDGVSEALSVLAVDIAKYTKNDSKKALLKLHKSMGHPTRDKLVEFLKDANSWLEEYDQDLGEIYERCDVCKQFARTPPKPVVSLPMASRFNQKVAMDLKSWDSRYILHMIDMWSRYTISVFVNRKTPNTIIDAVLLHWIGYFGVMGTVLTDNGGEFRNDEMRAVCSVLNVEILGTAAESPFQNGLCEKNHQVVDLMLHKLIIDFPKIKLDVLLRWANMSKNTLQMWNGFSSNQLVFGINPSLPNIFEASIPALEEATLSRTLFDHLQILHASRKAFIESEYSERIRRALRNRIRSSEVVYERGDRVFYKRDNNLMWLGPAKVVFQERKMVLLDHGGYYVKVSPNRLTKAPGEFGKLQGETQQEEKNESSDDETPPHQKVDDQPQEKGVEEKHPSEETSHVEDSSQETEHIPVVAEKVTPQPTRQSLRVLNKEHGWQVYMVTIPKNRHDDQDCMKAKEIELQKLQSFSVYDEVPDLGQTCISTRWVLWNKGKEVRARLVARGFEEDTSRIEVDSPTVGKSTVRMVLAVAAAKHWIIKSTDIKSAFLQGNVLQRDVYIKPPKEANVSDGCVWKLSRCLYGLNDAARQFYDSVVEELLHLGCMKSTLDPSLFFYRTSSGLSGILVAHIDDFLHAGDQSFDDDVMKQLSLRFQAGSNLETEFKYVGYQITQDSQDILLDQQEYIDSVEIIQMSAEREMQKYEALNPAELKKYRSMVGSLNWVVQGSRPDLFFQLVDLSTRFRSGTVDDLLKVRKILQKARDSKSEICFPDMGPVDGWKIVFYADASHANLCEGTGSCVGYIVFILGMNNRCCPLTWKSGKARRVVKSSIAAEAMALLDAIDESLYQKEILCQILSLSSSNLPIVGMTDNEGLWQAVRSTKLVDDRRLRIELAGVKENLQRGDIREIRWCCSAEMLADCLTKKNADGRKLLAVLQSGILQLPM